MAITNNLKKNKYVFNVVLWKKSMWRHVYRPMCVRHTTPLIIIIEQPWCPVVGPQHAVSKLFSCRMVSKWWHATSIGHIWGGWCVLPRTTSFLSHFWLCLCLLLVLVCDIEHTSFHCGMCGRKLGPCLFGECLGLCTICHSWQHALVVHLFLQAVGKVAFEEILVCAMILRYFSLSRFFSWCCSVVQSRPYT